MISHSMSLIRDYCDCGLLLSQQGAWYFDTVDDLIAAYQAAMGAKHG